MLAFFVNIFLYPNIYYRAKQKNEYVFITAIFMAVIFLCKFLFGGHDYEL